MEKVICNSYFKFYYCFFLQTVDTKNFFPFVHEQINSAGARVYNIVLEQKEVSSYEKHFTDCSVYFCFVLFFEFGISQKNSSDFTFHSIIFF